MREDLHNEVMVAIFLRFIFVFLLMILTGCDLRENAVIREQTDIFTDEIREKNKDMQSLSNQLKVANEKLKKFELMLMCREELSDEAVDQAKRDLLIDIPVIMNPQKSNKVQAERDNQ